MIEVIAIFDTTVFRCTVEAANPVDTLLAIEHCPVYFIVDSIKVFTILLEPKEFSSYGTVICHKDLTE